MSIPGNGLGLRVATYSRYHRAVVNPDGTIDIHRLPAADGTTTDSFAEQQQKSSLALANINRRNQEFWQKRGGIPE